MSQQIINVGSAPNDGQGDPIRTAFIKTNNNFSQLFSTIAGNSNNISNGTTQIYIPQLNGNILVDVGTIANLITISTDGISVAGNIVGNITRLVNGTSTDNGNVYLNYLELDNRGNVHIGENTTDTSGALIWDGGGSSILESSANGITLNPFNGYVTINGDVSATGNVTGNYIYGNGYYLTGISSGTGNTTWANIGNITNIDGPTSILIGKNVGNAGNIDTIAIGNTAAGNVNQGGYAVAIGTYAGYDLQGVGAISIGGFAGNTAQADYSIAIGYNSANNNQGGNSIAIGRSAGNNSQGGNAVAIGRSAGNSFQGGNSIAIGRNSANLTQGTESVAIGHSSGNNNQGTYAVALGAFAGNNNQGNYSVAIGSFAGYPTVANTAIVINGQATPLDAPNAGLYIAPIRNDNGNTTTAIYYNTLTSELTYAPAGSGSSYGDANVAAYLSSGNVTTAIITTNIVSATGNVRGSNLNTAGNVNANNAVVNAVYGVDAFNGLNIVSPDASNGALPGGTVVISAGAGFSDPGNSYYTPGGQVQIYEGVTGSGVEGSGGGIQLIAPIGAVAINGNTNISGNLSATGNIGYGGLEFISVSDIAVPGDNSAVALSNVTSTNLLQSFGGNTVLTMPTPDTSIVQNQVCRFAIAGTGSLTLYVDPAQVNIIEPTFNGLTVQPGDSFTYVYYFNLSKWYRIG